MISNPRMLVNKPGKGETKLSVTEKNIPASASVRRVAVSVQHVKNPAAKTNEHSHTNAPVYTVSSAVGVVTGKRKVLVGKLQDKEYRDAYVRATITHGIAHQIRVNRELRKLSQQSLAEKCGGNTSQVVISRLEDPAYGKFTLNSILKVASALDVAVLVRLVPYSKFILETADKSISGLYAKSFFEENLHAKQTLVTFTLTENKPLAQPYVPIDSPQKSPTLRIVFKPSDQSDARCGYASVKSN